MFVSGNSHTPVVNLFLKHSADVNIKTTAGRTTLMVASEKGHKEIVELLKVHGAEVDKHWPKTK